MLVPLMELPVLAVFELGQQVADLATGGFHAFPQLPGGHSQQARTERRKLHQRVGGADAGRIVVTDAGGQGLDVGIAGLALLGIDDLHLLPPGLLAGVALGPVAVKDQHHPEILEGGEIAQDLNEPGTGEP